MITVEQINLWLQQPKETQRLEFKEGKQQLHEDRLYEYCVALANEGGGHLVLGVTDAHPRKIVGTQAYNDPSGMATKIFQKLGFRVDVESLDHPDGRVVVFSIPSRPRGTAYNVDGKYMMRSGSSLVCMSEDRLRSIFDEGKPDWLEAPSKEKLSAQDVIELLDTQTFFELLKQPYPTTQQAVLEKLSAEKLIDRTEYGYSIRRMVLTFLHVASPNFLTFPEKRPASSFIRGGRSLRRAWIKSAKKAMPAVFKGLVGYIMDQLPQNEVIQDALRNRKETGS